MFSQHLQSTQDRNLPEECHAIALPLIHVAVQSVVTEVQLRALKPLEEYCALVGIHVVAAAGAADKQCCRLTPTIAELAQIRLIDHSA